MKGLLTKDLRIILLQKNSLFIMLIASLCMISMNLYTMIMFMCYMCCSLAIGTLSYDDFDNGMSYILCLPITKKKYIDEKFLLVLITTIIGYTLAMIIAYIFLFINHNASIDFFFETIILLPLVYLIETIQIPVRIKYGQEKSRIINIVSMIVVVVLGTLIVEGLMSISVFAKFVDIIILLLLLGGIFIIYHVSVKIMNSKQF